MAKKDPRKTWSERKLKKFGHIERRAPDLAAKVLSGAISFRRAEFLALVRAEDAKEKETTS
jgi:hypothetical protein